MSRDLVEPGTIVGAIYENERQIPLLFDVEAFRPTAKKAGIPSELTEQARARVCRAAFAYRLVRDNKGSIEAGSSFKSVKKELSSLLSATQTLALRLDAVSSEARNAIEWAEEIVAYEMLGYSPISSFGHSFFRYRDREGRETRTYLHFPQILEAVSVLRNMIDHILARARPADKGGRPFQTQATWVFIVEMREFWTNELKRSFTFDHCKGVPISEAAIFCWELLKFVDPKAECSEFCTAMRKAVQLDHPGRGRPRKSQKPLS
jgi:hypothetical protein